MGHTTEVILKDNGHVKIASISTFDPQSGVSPTAAVTYNQMKDNRDLWIVHWTFIRILPMDRRFECKLLPR